MPTCSVGYDIVVSMKAGATAAGRSEGGNGALQRVGASSTGEALSGADRISFASLARKGLKKATIGIMELQRFGRKYEVQQIRPV